MTYRARVAALTAAALVLATAACGGVRGSDSDSSGGTETTIGGLQAQFHGAKDVSGATGQVEVEMDDNYFEPTILEGTPGQKVTIKLTNKGQAAHTFTTPDRIVDQEVQPGGKVEVDITFPTSGEMTFVCTFHESSSMVGGLEVSPG